MKARAARPATSEGDGMLPWLPENVSTFGYSVDKIFYLIFWITGIVWVAVQTTMIVFLVKYRDRAGRQAIYSHGNNTLEIAWTIAPSVILVVLALLSRTEWVRIKQQTPTTEFRVEVVAKQFNWDFIYPGPDRQFGTSDDLTLENELNVPVDEVIAISLKSRDVIHSFFVPQLRLKQDAVPGRTIPVWFEATKPGTYEIPCAELCGFGHSGMMGHLIVRTAEGYAGWVKQRWPAANGGA
jgi:cytochrome c oxidase subunit 2